MKLIWLLFLLINLSASEYVGDNKCQECHKDEHKLWSGSHHDLAMQVADDKTVLGDFNDAKFTYNGITTTFFKKGSKFFVNTDGADGKLKDFEISHTFGVYPLQQYLVPFENGHIQVLDIAWDSRCEKDGGQRWYHIHAHDNVKAGDVLHWSGPNLNWNYMCADCHSTNLQKNYDQKTHSYNTTYDIINVSCEACHGTGKEHTRWTKSPKTYNGTLKQGLHVDMSSYKNREWDIDSKTLKATLVGEIDRTEVQLCAKCHSRRTQIADDFEETNEFSDNYLSAFLSQNLYHSDGKIKDEVYVYNSFLQSKMYEDGVTCSDCHDPHSLKRKGEGDMVCAKCHLPSKFEAKEHTKHNLGEAGCIGCHMPSNRYMGVDDRNDHSFRVPRPDLSVDSDIPNACNNCHDDEDASWATKAMKEWYGDIQVGKQNFSHQLQSLRTNSKDATKSVYELLMSDAPNIAKATAASYLGTNPSKQTHMTTMQLLRSSDANIRLGALRALESFPLEYRVKENFRLLDDSSKAVRLESARQLSSIQRGDLDSTTALKLSSAIDEYEKSLLFNSERAESQNALATLYLNLGEDEKAVLAYKEAIYIQAKYIPAYINFANYYKNKKESKKELDLLNRGLLHVENSPALYQALGLYYIRDKQSDKAMQYLKKSSTLNPNNAQYQYVYAVALSKTDIKSAIKILESSLQKHSGDMQTLYALVYYYNQLGNKEKVSYYDKQIKQIQNFQPKSE